jgi:hypothetical protein
VTAKKDRWEVHHDPYDVSRIWVRNHWDGGGWITVFWKHRVPVPFGELAWNHARQDLADQGEPVTETAIADTIPASLKDERRLWHNLAQQLTRLGADDERALRYATAQTAPAPRRARSR